MPAATIFGQPAFVAAVRIFFASGTCVPLLHLVGRERPWRRGFG